MLYAGLDVHKNFCQAIVMTKDGDIVKESRIKSEDEEIKEFFSEFSDLSVAFEATGFYESIYDLLSDLGFRVYLSHPLKTRLIADSKIKTDKIDAKALADLLRSNLLPTSYVPPKEIRRLRQLVRRRIILGRHRTKVKNHIHAELHRGNKKYSGPDVFTKSGIQWLHCFDNPSIDSYLRIYDTILEELKLLELRIKVEGAKYEEVRLLTTIPGIGNYSALLIFSEIGDISRFPSEDKLSSYGGMTPRVHQSGDNSYYGSITKEGSKHLRWILVECLRVHTRLCPGSNITSYYIRLRKRKPGNVATIAASRKMLQVIYHMLKNKTEYRG